MSDLVDRLLSRAYAFKAPDPLLEEAAAEIARLRINDAEREAVRWAIWACENEQTMASDAADRGYKLPDTREWAAKHGKRAATLRSLLERTEAQVR